jgi:iron complex outermembrane receptor protein
MHSLSPRNTLVLATALTTASLSGAVIAQDSAPSSTAKLMEEIVVSARGIEEGLQEAPIAVSAFTGETLDYRGVDSLDQIERFVPSLTLQNNPSFGGASNSAAIYLRGVGQKEFLPTTEPGVGLYVDGVYVARSVGAILDIVDIDRLEVLRGPQGTLFGRNTIGGAISIATRKPQPGGDFEGNVAAAAGTDGLLNLRGTVHVPVSDTVAIRASLARVDRWVAVGCDL